MSPNHIVLKFPHTTPGWNKWFSTLLALLFLLSIPAGLLAQSKKSLEEKRRKLIKEISVTDKLLKKTTKTREATYDRYVALQNQIERREKLIATLGQEIEFAQEGIDQNAGVIEALNQDLAGMRAEYGRLVRYAFRRKMLSSPLLFILSAENLNQAFRRWLFLRKYDNFRKEQAHMIAATQKMLSRKVAGLETTRTEKENLLISLQGQQSTLDNELTQKDKLLKTLAVDEDRLKQDLALKQKAHEELNQMIERIIQEEVRKQVEEARKPKVSAAPTPAKPGDKPKPVVRNDAPDEAAILSGNFSKNKGRLPWPVDNGFVSRGFGRQKHPTIKSVEITNNGIDIRTEEGSSVKAIFEGKVAGVQFIPGHDYTVILQHGAYYTVYSNLNETSLNKGDTVRGNQTIGSVAPNPITGASELHFELWFQKERMNPSQWIKK